MPKFGDGQQGEAFGYTIDKRNDTVGFEDKRHVYYDLKTGEHYISVTTLVSKYEQPYDEVFWSKYKAAEALLDPEDWQGLKGLLLETKKWNDRYFDIYDIDIDAFNTKAEEIRQGYKETREEACEHGTAEHLKKELSFYEDASKAISKYGFGGHFDCIPGMYQLTLERGVYPEFLISHSFPDLRVAGQVDLLVVNGNEISIGDFKTNKEIKKTSFYDKRKRKNEMMKYPVSNLQDSNYWHYALQLSLYMYLLQATNPKYICKRLFLVHIDRQGNETEYDVPYLKDEVERLIRHYSKHCKQQDALDKLKPVTF